MMKTNKQNNKHKAQHRKLISATWTPPVTVASRIAHYSVQYHGTSIRCSSKSDHPLITIANMYTLQYVQY
jgi:hypothetical protein